MKSIGTGSRHVWFCKQFYKEWRDLCCIGLKRLTSKKIFVMKHQSRVRPHTRIVKNSFEMQASVTVFPGPQRKPFSEEGKILHFDTRIQGRGE